MQCLTFSCPLTGRKIDSGISTDRNTFSKIQTAKLRLRCPHCDKAHQFTIESGRLADAA
jgi:hypothetical protein